MWTPVWLVNKQVPKGQDAHYVVAGDLYPNYFLIVRGTIANEDPLTKEIECG